MCKIEIEIFWIQLLAYNTAVWGLTVILVKEKQSCRFCHTYNFYNRLHIHKTLSILNNILSIYVNNRKFSGKINIEGALMRESQYCFKNDTMEGMKWLEKQRHLPIIVINNIIIHELSP